MADNQVSREEFSQFTHRVDERFNSIDEKFNSMDKRFDSIEGKLDVIMQTLPLVKVNQEAIIRNENRTNEIQKSVSELKGSSQIKERLIFLIIGTGLAFFGFMIRGFFN